MDEQSEEKELLLGALKATSYIPYARRGLDGRAICAEVAQDIISEQATGDASARATREFKNKVWKLVRNMAGDQKFYSLRFGSFFLTHMFKWLYNGELFVKPEATAILREMAPTTTFVYVPTHKSHLDYHMLSFILFSEGLACPHIAAGDNLNLPIVGAIMRTCGAFFIRRSLKGSSDAVLYKQVLDAYMHTLLQHGISTEFFIEGGRTRDGRIAVPRLGLLASAVDASLDKPITKPVCIVPVAITYDLPLEEQGLLLELLGQSKKKETIWQFLSAFGGLLFRLAAYMLVPRTRPLGCGGVKGRVAVAFGEPISVQKFLKDRNRRRKKRSSNKKALAAPPKAAPLGDDFDEVLAQFAAKEASVNNADDDKDGGAETKEAHSAAKLQESMPPASEARRNAVLALGTEIHTAMLKINVVPSSALLAAALLPPNVFGAPSPSRRRAPRCESLASVAANYAWLQGRIAARDHACMQLPSTPSTAASTEEFLTALAVACAPYVALTPARLQAPSSAGEPATLALRATPVAALWQHARLNYLLPVFGGHSLVACSLLAVARSAPAAHAGAHPRGGAPAGSHVLSICQNAASSAVVLEKLLWLRRLMAADLDDAFGSDVLASKTHVNALLDEMERTGMVTLSLVDAGESAGGNGAVPSVCRAVQGAARDFIFAGALLAPIIATYAGVLRHAAALLEACEAQALPRVDLVAGVLGRLRDASAAASSDDCAQLCAVPSRLLVQNALRAWEQEGLLAVVPNESPELTPSSSLHGRAIGNMPLSTSSFNLNIEPGDSPAKHVDLPKPNPALGASRTPVLAA